LKNAWHTGSWSGMPRSKGGQGYYTKISAKNDDGDDDDDDDDGSVSLNVRPYTGFSFSYSHNVLRMHKLHLRRHEKFKFN